MSFPLVFSFLNGIIYLILLMSLQVVVISAGEEQAIIEKCGLFTPRTTIPDDVQDLQISDIKFVAGLGDSIMAGLLIDATDDIDFLGIHNHLGLGKINPDSITEYRGQSYAVGGDTNATTLPNLIKRYNPNIQGASIGEHFLAPCHMEFCPESFYRPQIDRLNAARSSAIAANLDQELEYLIPQMKKTPGFQTDWKLITINIGNNDQCEVCNKQESKRDYVTTENYGKYVEAAVERIRMSVPRAIVNIVGNFKVSLAYQFLEHEEQEKYCNPFLGLIRISKVLCPCFNGPDENRKKMDEAAEGYNRELERIYQKYKAAQYKDFAVLFQPADINVLSFPRSAINNVDCFHPSLLLHEWFAKILWNNLFRLQSEKPSHYEYDGDMLVHCPNESHRILI
ncbi:hypothetical protein BDA99DRAFT_572299 [Phascolomyces articulosus]|uniref:Uncharacterized protein n=1 Tax=Phascolomyces articulosus TaxID=60185 RepID=A0AAD5KA00_9FUNG|nr:hypothetical protein BDA99DRAFT_572299 [Phascolomyces articulosus]